MGALTANLGSGISAKYGAVQAYLVAASVHIYRGALIGVKLGDGYAYPIDADGDDSEKFIFIGHAREEMDNSFGSDGAKTVRVRRDGQLKINFTGTATQADVGHLACAYDDQTVARYQTGTTIIVVGRIVKFENSTEVWVDLKDRPQRVTGSAND